MPSTILSDNGVTSGTSGIKTTGSNDGTLALQTTTAGGAATTALSISTAQVVTLTNALPVASGGSGVTTSTGTGANVLGTSPTITTPTISSLSSASATALTLQSAGTTAITVDTSQNVGIGVTPSAWASKALQIGTYIGYGIDANGYGFMANNAWNYTASSYKYTVSSLGACLYSQNFGSHQWSSASSGTAGNAISFTPVLLVEKDKSLALQGATSVSGTGITFPATQSASSDANTLDDYEEGTYTMTWTCDSGSITMNTSTTRANYTKIGRVVIVNAYALVTSVSSPNGLLNINLPFNSASINGGARSSCWIAFNTLGTGGNIATAWPIINDSASTCQVYVGSGTGVSSNFAAYLIANTDARVTFVYITS